MKKYTKFLMICMIVTAVLFILSSLLSQEKLFIEFETANGGGGVEAIAKEGFPINYIENPTINDPYSVDTFKLVSNAIFWLAITIVGGQIYRKGMHENTRH